MANRHPGFVYLARPVDLSSAPLGLVDLITESLRDVAVYNPAGAWVVSSDTVPSPVIQSVNVEALNRAALVVGILTEGPSLGVPSEITKALETGTPVVLFVTTGLLVRSWYLHWLMEQKNLVGVFNCPVEDEDQPSVWAVKSKTVDSQEDMWSDNNKVRPKDLRDYFRRVLDVV